MRLVLAVALVALAATPAAADRIPFITLGGTMDMRFTGHTWHEVNEEQRPDLFGGGRVTLSFEDRPLPLQPAGVVKGALRLVPELFVGALGNDRLAEAYVGVGARAETALAAHALRMTLYLAGRGLVIGANHDGVAELAVGGYITLRGGTRIGLEEAADVRPRYREGGHEIGADVNAYVGWAL